MAQDRRRRASLARWVHERSPLLAAAGALFLCVAVLILVELLVVR